METVFAADEAPAPGPSPIMLELRYTFENDPVFEPITFPKRFIPEIPLLRADTWPIRVVPEMVDAATVFDPARDPYSVTPEMVEAATVFEPARDPYRVTPEMVEAAIVLDPARDP